ncbi:hypothetical protein [Nonomuraea soli]|uniref:Mersacidin/lichenicidin family type 2 lantibiotic n=1 Tax=Nonomuraea soli TaxID=1032476 RepID=A0A7W0HSV4_9ACTN|nr:hypothetical protein [Nonomuraea soli]MBA2894322.1 hypothetical protein [Nonomuraea soli]
MSSQDLIDQWKNPHTRAAGAAHPSGEAALEEQLVGGRMSITYSVFTYGCCKTSMSLLCG